MRNIPQALVLPVAIFVATCAWPSIGSCGEPAVAARKKAAKAASGSATLSWYPPTANEDGSPMADLAGYRIYYGKNAKRLNRVIVLQNPGLTRYMVESLVPGKWHFAISAVNDKGQESKQSESVSKQTR